VIVLALICCYSADAQTKPIVSIDLTTAGIPQDAFSRKNYKDCPRQYFGYRSVEWLDEHRILVAFNTSPDCALKDGLLDGSLRIATFDLQGKMLQSTDVAYQAGDGGAVRVISHGGIWIGPDHTVIVEIPSPHLKALPDSRDKVLVFSDELTQIQVFDTDDHDRIGDGTHFAGVTEDRRRVLFSTPSDRETKERTCLSYSKFPVTDPDACSLYDLGSIKQRPDVTAVPKGYEFRAFPGASPDGLRSSVFAVKEENAPCMLFGKFCRLKGTIVVFEPKTKRTLLKMDIPLDGRAALSPDGRSLAVLQQNKLEIFVVP
jgi:hypothetical protein